jgi:hypothetical protein
MSVVTAMTFSLEYEWLLSISRDKYFQLHDASNGKRLGGYQAEAWCTAMQYPLIIIIWYIELFGRNEGSTK